MAILLTTPLDTGDIDSVDYAEAKMLEFVWDGNSEQMRLLMQYGNTVSGEWIPGKPFNGPVYSNPQYHLITGQAYVDCVSEYCTCSGTPVLVYENVKNILYQYLVDQDIYPGTIV